MQQSYSQYYKRKVVSIIVPGDNSGDDKKNLSRIEEGYIFFGVRSSDTLLSQRRVLSCTGLLDEQAFLSESNILGKRASMFFVSRLAVAGKINLVKEFTFTLVAVDTEDPIWGSKHKTSLIFDADLPASTVASNLYEIKISSPGNYDYNILSGSITEKRSKASAPIFTLGGGGLLNNLNKMNLYTKKFKEG